MNYYVYILKSVGQKKITYVGYTSDLKKESNFITMEKGLNLLEVGSGD